MGRQTSCGYLHKRLCAALVYIFCCIFVEYGSNAAPLTLSDIQALQALSDGFLTTTRLGTTLAPKPWNSGDIPNICDTVFPTSIECGTFNVSHSTIVAIHGIIQDERLHNVGHVFRLRPGWNRFPMLREFDFPYATALDGIPAEIGTMTSLKIFRLGGARRVTEENPTITTIPESIGNLIALTELTLDGQFLGGSLPSTLTNLVSLEKLSLHANMLTGPLVDMSNSRNLTEFGLSGNKLSGNIPTWVGNFPKLENLLLANNRFDGPIPPMNCPLMYNLDLSWNSLSGAMPNSIAVLPNLEYLRVDYNQLNAQLPDVWNLPRLQEIRLSGNTFTGSLPNSMSNLPTSLRRFEIADNRFSGSLPSWIGAKTNLVFLATGGNSWTPAPVPSWISQLGNLYLLRMHASNIIGDVPTLMGTASSLVSVDFSDNNLNCPPANLVNVTNCFWNGNNFCAQNRTHLFQPTCDTVPAHCRTTPCMAALSESSSAQTYQTSTCAGKSMTIPSASSTLTLSFDACLPKATMSFKASDGRIISLSASIQNVTDGSFEYRYERWALAEQNWKLSFSNIASRNNPLIPQLTYSSTLPNGANFSVPFLYFEKEDNLKIFGKTLPVTSKTLKFGVDVDRWKTAQLRYRAYMGLDIRIETNEPFKVNRDLLDFLQAVKDPTILVPSFSVDFPAVNATLFVRLPVLGQQDFVLDLTGTMDARDPRVIELFTTVGQNIPTTKLDIPLMIVAGSKLVYDPDLALVFDFVEGIGGVPSIDDQLSASTAQTIGIVVGVILGAVVLGLILLVALVPTVRYKMLPFLRKTETVQTRAELDDVDEEEPQAAESKRGSVWMQARSPSMVTE